MIVASVCIFDTLCLYFQIDVTWFYSNCLTDTCGCNQGGDCECFCTSVSAYAHQCCQHGVAVDWRSPRVCRKFTQPVLPVAATAVLRPRPEKSITLSYLGSRIEPLSHTGRNMSGCLSLSSVSFGLTGLQASFRLYGWYSSIFNSLPYDMKGKFMGSLY